MMDTPILELKTILLNVRMTCQRKNAALYGTNWFGWAGNLGALKRWLLRMARQKSEYDIELKGALQALKPN